MCDQNNKDLNNKNQVKTAISIKGCHNSFVKKVVEIIRVPVSSFHVVVLKCIANGNLVCYCAQCDRLAIWCLAGLGGLCHVSVDLLFLAG